MRTFCCCIPVRLGVLLLSSLTAILGALQSYAQIYLLVKLGSQSSTAFKIIHGFGAAVAIILTLASVAGLIGSCLTSRPFVAFYSRGLWLTLLVYTGVCVANIVLAFNDKDGFISDCTASDLDTTIFGQTTSGTRNEICDDIWKATAITVAVLLGLTLLVLFWLASIVTRYKHQLEAEDDHRYVKTSYANKDEEQLLKGADRV